MPDSGLFSRNRWLFAKFCPTPFSNVIKLIKFSPNVLDRIAHNAPCLTSDFLIAGSAVWGGGYASMLVSEYQREHSQSQKTIVYTCVYLYIAE